MDLKDKYKDKIEELISDRQKFNDLVYTSLGSAITAFDERQSDKQLADYLEKELRLSVPAALTKGKTAVLARPIASPNYEMRRFVSIVEAIEGFCPVVWEYLDSKFTPQNDCKYYLARMPFYFGHGKKGGLKLNYLNIIDIDGHNGKKISEIKTHCGKHFKDFHHEILDHTYKDKKIIVNAFDASSWYDAFGSKACVYYKHYLALFLKDAILFENFMLDVKEVEFTREIFLPAFLELVEETGKKPLIVALEPTETEGDNFWMSYPGEIMELVQKKLNLL